MRVLQVLLSLSLFSLISAHPSMRQADSFKRRNPNSNSLTALSNPEGTTKTTALVPRASDAESDDDDEKKKKKGSKTGKAGGIIAALFIVPSIVTGLKDMVNEDKLERSNFTQALVGNLFDQDPNKNYVVVSTKHKAEFNGEQGTDWDMKHIDYEVKVGAAINYKVYISQKGGNFELKGDGGYLNWAYKGYLDSDKTSGKKLVFVDAPEPSGTATPASEAAVPKKSGEGITAEEVGSLIIPGI